MMNRKISYNTDKAIDLDGLKSFIKEAKENGDWSRVESANVSEITDMSRLFQNIQGIENLNLRVARACPEWARIGFDTSNVKNMSYMFCKSNYNHQLHFDTSNTKDMCSMFSYSKYNHSLDFDTSNVTNMWSMFKNSQYNRPLDFRVARAYPEWVRIGYDISNVKYMKNIFDGASITLPITFKGGNVHDDVQTFIDETNIAYDKSKIKNAAQNCNVIVQPLKL